jgi:NAD-dependent deacetylase
MENLVKAIREAEHILVITGAGISTGSGLSTYRGTGGSYSDLDIPPEILMSEQVFAINPELSWEQFHILLDRIDEKQPSASHYALADLEKHTDVTILTHNIDGFHTIAGSTNVIEIHGTSRRIVCVGCDWVDNNPIYTSYDAHPICPECGSSIKPDAVLFGGSLPEDEVEKLNNLVDLNTTVAIAIGTTFQFPYISLPFYNVYKNGGFTVVIDPEPADDIESICSVVIKEKSDDVLPEIVKNV